MRLTLRTLLAHEHGLLNEQQAELISQKIEQSPFVAQLLRHLKDRAVRREIVPLAIEARGAVCLEKVARYLDYTLPAEEVVKLENECFASDRLLAEVASCHEIISQWLSTPTPIEPTLRQRLYAILPGSIGAISATSDELAIDLPALAYQSAPPSTPSVEREVPVQTKSEESGWIAGAFRLFALAASVLILVTYVAMNRDKVEAMIAQHWQDKSRVTTASDETSPTPKKQIVPDTLVSQSNSMTPIEMASPREAVPARLPEVATTAFHMPIPVDRNTAKALAWDIEEAKGSFYQEFLGETWQTAGLKQLGAGRVVVSTGGQLRMVSEGLRFEVGQLSELSLSEDGLAKLRYGTLIIDMESDREFMMDVAGQQVKIATLSDPVRLALSTRAVVSRGLDFAATTANQEVHFEGISGKVDLTIPGCRGPIPLEHGQMVISHVKHGVRGGDTSVLDEMQHEGSDSTLAETVQASSEPIRFLHDTLSSEVSRERLAAAMTLTQLGLTDAWSEIWSQFQGHQIPGSYLVELRNLWAQDSALVGNTKRMLLQQNPEHGPLIYRLICGFSDDQLTGETRLQLKSLLGHPEPAVQTWARFQLSQRQIR
ncbi:hypothetical protein Pan97_49320 [Bremerella volcania]|uniref:FecR protein n=1 Tax=Bremerella volcania TaxID=2527984 RepID=A0A518CF45_9BACT|nr:hypothetical protein [Bremerella volcania]QDU77853.1 hypothetical protein Pan97_49320 [Bremerella volcania]